LVHRESILGKGACGAIDSISIMSRLESIRDRVWQRWSTIFRPKFNYLWTARRPALELPNKKLVEENRFVHVQSYLLHGSFIVANKDDFEQFKHDCADLLTVENSILHMW